MVKPNIIEFKVSGDYALFSDPVNRMGGEKISYQVPTYEALKGIASSIYWKPTIIWVIDKVRVLKPIQSESRGVRPINYDGASGTSKPLNTLSVYTYLKDVEYQVQAHFEWNMNRPELAKDRNENKHHNIAKRCVNKGGRRDVFLGTRECQAYVEPCVFGEGEGVYDDYGDFPLGMMFHGFTYPDENSEKKFLSRFWNAVMTDGVIEFIRPEECSIVREISQYEPKVFSAEKNNMAFVDEINIDAEFGGDVYELDK